MPPSFFSSQFALSAVRQNSTWRLAARGHQSLKILLPPPGRNVPGCEDDGSRLRNLGSAQSIDVSPNTLVSGAKAVVERQVDQIALALQPRLRPSWIAS